jgi:hypothetical protein
VHPLFDGVTDHVLRALIAVGLGCDAWSGGIFNFRGPKSAVDELERLAAHSLSDSEQNDTFAAALAKDLSSAVKGKEPMLCFAQLLPFEKCSFGGYIHDPLLRLYKYVEEFACPQTMMDTNGRLKCWNVVVSSVLLIAFLPPLFLYCAIFWSAQCRWRLLIHMVSAVYTEPTVAT